MVVDAIWEGFKKLFPTWVDNVESYKKIGSKTIEIKIKDSDNKLIFLYNDPWDWTFGSKVWRAKPRSKPKLDFSQLEKKWNTNIEEDDGK